MDVTGLSYGEGKAFSEQQSAAPMSPPSSSAAPLAPSQTPFDAPSARPGEPVTAGADAGAGPSSADIGLGAAGEREDLRARFGPYLDVFVRMADSRYASQPFKLQVRDLLSRIS